MRMYEQCSPLPGLTGQKPAKIMVFLCGLALGLLAVAFVVQAYADTEISDGFNFVGGAFVITVLAAGCMVMPLANPTPF